jgi:hypothetical protein
MATLLSALETQVRVNLNAPAATDLFWSSTEIIFWLNQGSKDLWKAIKDLYQKHHYTIDQTNVSLAASSNALSGVPADVHDVAFIRARVPANYPSLRFVKADYGSLEFEGALAMSSQDSAQAGVILYDIIAAGGPVSAPTIKVAPQVNAAILLELGYVPTIGNQTSAQNNPIPGESDAALIAYATAWCRAKERPDKMPDPGWIAIYGTEKDNLCTALTPRSIQDPEYVEGMFEGWED